MLIFFLTTEFLDFFPTFVGTSCRSYRRSVEMTTAVYVAYHFERSEKSYFILNFLLLSIFQT